uniref:Uncharacterized protein n=2 Tax=Guillardia theta TaxID=55529 RepID=A0A7S4PPB2_GUITH|mmetsp:Transcript_8273/g.27857  ORF Transcript_8273/g.27857 Transcript_8273/m.27857 type:complete len:493 (+) Transcript_8273:165-1643(+)
MFDSRGVIYIEDIEKAELVLASLSAELYDEMKEGVSANFELAKKYLDPLGWIWKNGLEEVVGRRRSERSEVQDLRPGREDEELPQQTDRLCSRPEEEEAVIEVRVVATKAGKEDLLRCLESIASQNFCGRVKIVLSHTQAQFDQHGSELFYQSLQLVFINSSFGFDLFPSVVPHDYQTARALEESVSIADEGSTFQWVLWIDARDWMADRNLFHSLQLAQEDGCEVMLAGWKRFPLPVEDPTARLTEEEERESILLNQFRKIIGHRILQGSVPLPAFAASRRMLKTAFDESLSSYVTSHGSILQDWDFAPYTVRLQEIAGERQCIAKSDPLVHSEFASRRVFAALSREIRTALGAFFSDIPPARSQILGRMRPSLRARACERSSSTLSWGHVAGLCDRKEIEILSPQEGSRVQDGMLLLEVVVRGFWIPEDIKGIVLEISGNRLHEGVLEVRRLRQELSIAAGLGLLQLHVWAVDKNGQDVVEMKRTVNFVG